jgi:RNA polymerase sigma-70 factor (ECF subfamily)
MDAAALFEILIRENAGMLTAYLRSVARDPTTVDDLFQETCLTAWRKLDEFDKSRPFGPWLRGIAANVVLTWRRKHRRAFLLCDEQILEHLDRRCEAVHQLAGDTWDEKLAGLKDCLDQLPDRYREPIRLRYLEDLLPEALAQRLGLELETIKKRLQRGRARLWECLQRKLRLAEVPA